MAGDLEAQYVDVTCGTLGSLEDGTWLQCPQELAYQRGEPGGTRGGEKVAMSLSMFFAEEEKEEAAERKWLRRCSASGETESDLADLTWVGARLAMPIDPPGQHGVTLCVDHADEDQRCAMIFGVSQEDPACMAVSWHRDWFEYVPVASFGVHLSDSGQVHVWADSGHCRIGGDPYGTVHRNWKPKDEVSLTVNWEKNEWSLYLNRKPIHTSALPESCCTGVPLRGTVWLKEEDSLVSCSQIPIPTDMRCLERLQWWNKAQMGAAVSVAGYVAEKAMDLATAGCMCLLPNSVTACLEQGHTRLILDLCFSPDEATMFTCSADNQVKAWSLHNGSCLWTSAAFEQSVSSIAYWPGGPGDAPRLLLGMHKKKDNIEEYALPAINNCRETQSLQCLRVVGGHSRNVSRLLTRPAAGLLFSTGDLVARRWDLSREGGKVPSVAFKGHEHLVLDIALTADGERLATASHDGSAMVFEATSAVAIAAVRPAGLQRSKLTSVVFTGAGDLCIGTGRGVIIKYRLSRYDDLAEKQSSNCIADFVDVKERLEKARQTAHETRRAVVPEWSGCWQVTLAGKWKDLDEDVDLALKQAFLSGESVVTQFVNHKEYAFDLASLHQEDPETGRQRKIRPPTNSKAVWQATQAAEAVAGAEVFQLDEVGRFVGHGKGGSVRRLITVDYRATSPRKVPSAVYEEDSSSTPRSDTWAEEDNMPASPRGDAYSGVASFDKRMFVHEWMVSAASDGMVKVWSVDEHTCLHTVVGHKKAVRACAALAKRRLVTAGDDRVARFWVQPERKDMNLVWRKPAMEFRSATITDLFITPMSWLFMICQFIYIGIFGLPPFSGGSTLSDFRIRFYACLGMMALSALLVIADVYRLFDSRGSQLLCNPAFSSNVQLQQMADEWDQKRNAVWMLLYGTSTILFLRVIKQGTTVFDCYCLGPHQDPHGSIRCLFEGNTDLLLRDVDLPCYTGEHMAMVIATVLLAPLFMLAMLPLGLAGGDESLLDVDDESGLCRHFCQRLSVRTWRYLAQRRLHIWTGVLSRRTGWGLAFQGGLMLTNLAIGISSSALALEPESMPVVHAVTGLVLLVTICVWPPTASWGYTLALRLICLGNLLAGIAGILVHHTDLIASIAGAGVNATWLPVVEGVTSATASNESVYGSLEA